MFFVLKVRDDGIDNIANNPFMSKSHGVRPVLPFPINL